MPVTDPTTDDPHIAQRTRAPAGIVAAAVVLGILLDRLLLPGWAIWTTLAFGFFIGTCLVRKRSTRLATLSLLACCVTVGGMRHHLTWSAVAADEISRLADDAPRPIRVIGTISSPMAILSADESELTPRWMQIDRSACDLRCEQLLAGDERRPVSGTVRLIVTGHVLHANVGDRVEVAGQLTLPGRPLNPGAFDYRQYLQKQGVRCLIDCDHPDAVQRLTPQVSQKLARLRTRLRGQCEQLLVEHLDPKTAPLAISLLLGLRSQLPGDVRTAFAESGTMHLLAISGLHVGILAWLLLVGCRLLNLSVLPMTMVLLLGIASYAFVTNLRPPVVRASVLAVAAAAAWPTDRRVSGTNLIAVCALTVLLIDPTDLFDTGTQLSFLAVIAIGWAVSFIERQRRRLDTESLLPRLLARERGWPGTLRCWLVEGYVITAAIWLFTLPLTISQFHIAAPIGFLINVLLLPFVGLLLGLGFVTIVCGLLLPSLAPWPAALFDGSLHALLRVVEFASELHLGHRYLAGPPGWWLVGFYGLLGAILLFRAWPVIARWGWSLVWGWVVLGLSIGFYSPHRENLRCTFLNMGHGCCVVLELPGGQTVLYDAGLLGSQRRGQQIVQAALWQCGLDQIDGIITSHADVDHFNIAVPVIETMPVGTLLASRSFLDFEQPAVEALCETASRQQVPIRFVQAGDRLRANDPRISLDVLQPAYDWAGESDNANSIVLRVNFAGRSLLLPGDLEGDGLTRLLSGPPQPIDVLLAPHHGSQNSNPTSLARWANPRIVIASGGDERTMARLKNVYSQAKHIYCTPQDGAVTVEISAEGEMTVTPFRRGP